MAFSLSPRAVFALFAVAIPAACSAGNTQPPPRAAAIAPHKSWMLSGAAAQPSLLYISNSETDDVTVYTYSDGGGILLVGTLTGFSLPTGMCTDAAGDVWVSDYSAKTLYEYAHGGTTPLRKIKQLNGLPYDCAVDLKTGNLAVANELPRGKLTFGNVTVYTQAKGRGQAYFPGYGFASVGFVTYDNQSNLFVDGQTEYGYAALYVLPKNATQLTQVTLSGATLYSPAAVQWDKPILLLGDQNYQNQGTSVAYKLFVSGSTATVVGTIPFDKTQKTYGFWRRATKVIVPDHLGSKIRIYNVSDGSLVNTFGDAVALPFGAVVSQSP